jgi:hypothetical protein
VKYDLNDQMFLTRDGMGATGASTAAKVAIYKTFIKRQVSVQGGFF